MDSFKDDGTKSFKDLKCIWMSSKVVEYKLCNKNFDCENCHFDKVIRNIAGEFEQVETEKKDMRTPVDEVISRIRNQNFDSKYIYLQNQLVVKHLFVNSYYIGLNPITLFFLDGVNEIIDGGREGMIRKNQVIFKLQGDFGFITITSPMNFNVVEKLAIKPEDLFTNKWFAMITLTDEELESCKLTREQWQMNQINSIRLLNDIKISYPSVGTTMMDGGVPVKSLNRMIGSDAYLKILSKLFNE